MITYRSNHMPMFTTIDSTNVARRLRRIFLNQNSCGLITLHVIMIQYDHEYGPLKRLMKA